MRLWSRRHRFRIYDSIRGEWLSGIQWRGGETIVATQWTKAEPLAMWLNGLRRAREIKDKLKSPYTIIIDRWGKEVTECLQRDS